MACMKGCYGCAEFILDADVEGWLIDWRDRQGKTPLHYAVQHGQVSMVSLLLDNGAKTDEADKHGLSPGQLAVKLGKEECDKIIQASTAIRIRDVTNAGGDQTRFYLQWRVENKERMAREDAAADPELLYSQWRDRLGYPVAE